jgi:hypothetical protein
VVVGAVVAAEGAGQQEADDPKDELQIVFKSIRRD